MMGCARAVAGGGGCGFCGVFLTSSQEQGGPQINVQHHVIGTRLVVSSHVVLRDTGQPIQGQRQQLRREATPVRERQKTSTLSVRKILSVLPLFLHPNHLLSSNSVASKCLPRGTCVRSRADPTPQRKSAPLEPTCPPARASPRQLQVTLQVQRPRPYLSCNCLFLLSPAGAISASAVLTRRSSP